MKASPGPLTPSRKDSLRLPSDARVEVSVATPSLPHWAGTAEIDTFSGRPLLDFSGAPCFAELWILHCLGLAGWNGRWVVTYPSRKSGPLLLRGWDPRGIKFQTTVPIDEDAAVADLERVVSANGGSVSGCWDVFAWRGSSRLFVKSKWVGKDRIRSTQLRWVESAMTAGIGLDSFLIAEWKAERADGV